MDVVADLPADPQSAKSVQVSERALYSPALLAQAGAALGATAGDQRLHAEIPDEKAVLVMVVPRPRKGNRPRNEWGCGRGLGVDTHKDAPAAAGTPRPHASGTTRSSRPPVSTG